MRKWLFLLGFAVGVAAEAPIERAGRVWAVEEQAVYFTLPDGTAVKAPRNATFLKGGKPVPPEQLRPREPITVIYPEEDFEILAGPYPPNANNAYYHRTIRRGPESVHQNFLEGRWKDRP